MTFYLWSISIRLVGPTKLGLLEPSPHACLTWVVFLSLFPLHQPAGIYIGARRVDSDIERRFWHSLSLCLEKKKMATRLKILLKSFFFAYLKQENNFQ